MRRLWTRIFETSGAKIYGLILGIISLSLTSRLLGPEGRGDIAAVTTWVAGAATFGSLTLGQVALHRLSTDARRERYGAVLGSLVAVTLVVTLLSWSVAVAVKLFWTRGPLADFSSVVVAVAFLSLPFLLWEQYGGSLLVALERLGITNRYQVLGRSVTLLAVYVFVGRFGWAVAGALAATLAGQIVVGSGGLRVLFQEAILRDQPVRPTRIELKELLAGGVRLHLNSIGTFFFNSASILLLHRFLGSADTGLFQLASQLVGIMMIVPQSASMVVYGRVAQAGPNEAWPTHRRLVLQVLMLMCLGSVLAAVVAPLFVRIIAGATFARSIPLFRWLLLTVPGGTLAAVMAPQWIGRGYFGLAAGITLLMGLVNVIASFWLIRRHGTAGAIGANVVTYVVAIVANGLMFRHCDSEARRSSGSSSAFKV